MNIPRFSMLLVCLPLMAVASESVRIDFNNFANGVLTTGDIRAQGVELRFNQLALQITEQAGGNKVLEENTATNLGTWLRIRCAQEGTFELSNLVLYDSGSQPATVSFTGSYPDGTFLFTTRTTQGVPGSFTNVSFNGALAGLSDLVIDLDGASVDDLFIIKRGSEKVKLNLIRVGRIESSGYPNYVDTRDNLTLGLNVTDFRMAKTEVTNRDYAIFLNAADPSGTNSDLLWSSSMASAAEGGIFLNTGRPVGQRYYTKPFFADKPVNFVSSIAAAKFANWLHLGQLGGDYSKGAYNSITPTSLGGREAGARVFLPSRDEWHVAAFAGFSTSAPHRFFRDYPTSNGFSPSDASAFTTGYASNPSETTPRAIQNQVFNWNSTTLGNVGAVNSCGTANQSFWGIADLAGNVMEWTETISDAAGSSWVKGGGFSGSSIESYYLIQSQESRTDRESNLGIRLAAPLQTRVNPCFERIGYPGNNLLSDGGSSGVGSVADVFYMSRNELTAAEYTVFLNSVDPAAANTLGLWDSAMGNSLGSIRRDLNRDSGHRYYTIPGRDDFPVNYVGYDDAMRFCNWMHNGQTSGGTEDGAYTLTGVDPADLKNVRRNAGAWYYLPNADEWTKAAFYHPLDSEVSGTVYRRYATGSNAAPTASVPTALLENAGNYNSVNGGPVSVWSYPRSGNFFHLENMAGNVSEWIEAGPSTSASLAGANYFSTAPSERGLSIQTAGIPLGGSFLNGIRLCMSAKQVSLSVTRGSSAKSMLFKFRGIPNQRYMIQYDTSSSLSGPWQNNASFMTGMFDSDSMIMATGAEQFYLEQNALNTSTQFYRALRVDTP